jgi:hypothetical protein
MRRVRACRAVMGVVIARWAIGMRCSWVFGFIAGMFFDSMSLRDPFERS